MSTACRQHSVLAALAAAATDANWQKAEQPCCIERANWVFALLVLGPDAVLPMLSLSLCCQCCKTTAYLLRCLRTYSRHLAPPGHHQCRRSRRAANRMARATASTSRQQQARLMWQQPAVMLAAVETVLASMGDVLCVMLAPAIKRSQHCFEQLCSSAKTNTWLKAVTGICIWHSWHATASSVQLSLCWGGCPGQCANCLRKVQATAVL